MSRSQQDTVIDDDEETCPLCIEEFDLSDKNFRPCPCGYQICQFCFNSLKTTYEKSTCPNCRRVYDEKTIQYKIPTPEEFKLDQQNKIKKQAASKRKESEKREVETSSRRNLAGVRVKQQNLVYVIGLVPSIKDENVLLQTLRGDEYFGQYGEIEKIVVSKAKPGAVNQGVGVYVTYTTKEAAATCINAVDGSMNGDRVLRAQFGTTKYCSAYLRGEVCNNKSCSFLHETGEDGQTTTLQNESTQAKPAQRPSYTSQPSQHQPQARQNQPVPPSAAPSTSSSQPMMRQSSKDEVNSRKGSTDASALPSSVNWANPHAPVVRTRRTSQAASRSSPSPQIANATMASHKPEEPKADETTNTPPNQQLPTRPTPLVPSPANNAAPKATSTGEAKKNSRKRRDSVLDQLIASVNSPEFRFVFDDSAFSPEELAALERHSVMIDPFGGVKLRLKREREAAERAKQEEAHMKAPAGSQSKASANEEAVEDEPLESGSLALGGEPEDNSRSVAARSAIQRPSQPSSTNTFLNDQFSGLNGRSLTPHQRQQMAQLGSSNLQQAPGLGHPAAQAFSAGAFEFDPRSALSQSHHESSHGHARQHSRFNFSSTDSAKPNTARYPTQQPSAGSQHFYASGVQGPPPGLKTAGTPPISGGGMFAQGHGFTSNMNAGFGTVKDTNTDMLIRGRSGTNTGHDISKREYLLSFQNTNLRSPPPSAPAPGLLNSLYGQYAGAYQDPGLVKQKKKGKKHRHANTSSSGGGVVDLADPSILQARLHQSGAGAGQGLFGGQNQDDIDFPPLAPVRVLETANPLRSHVHSVRSSQDSTARSTTPKIPPGLSLPHAHPSPSHGHETPTYLPQHRPSPATPGPVAPAVPTLPIGQRVSTPKMKSKNESIVEAKPAKKEGTMNSKPNTSKPDEPSTTASKTGVASNSGSPMLKQARTIADHHVTSTLESAVAGRGQTNSTENSPRPVDVVAPMDSLSRPTAENHYSAAAKGTKGPAPMQSTVTNENRVLAASTDAIPPTSSRPGTPADVASKTSEASAMRSRTIRVTTVVTPKPDTTTPASAVTEKSGVLPSGLGKQRSRQPSISSISRSRPSTPAVSDHIYSNDVSRASSPPPSIVGSVPERPKAKNQIRKEKKSKAKETTETNSEGPPTPVERKVEEVAPIISRHKKKRKTPDRSTADGGADPAVATEKVDHKMPTASGSTKAAKQQSSKDATPTGSGEHKLAEDVAREAEVGKKSATPVTGKEDKTASNTTLKDPYTLNQLLADSGKTNDPEAFKTLLDEHISNIQTLLSQLFDSKQLDHSSALFNLPPLTSYRLPPDSRRGADYLDGNGYTMSSPFGEVYLDSKQRKELQQGSAVRISDQNRPNDLLKRTLITKGGRVYRHLSQEEEEKVLALERRREEDERMYGELGAKAMLKVDEADFLNIEGGLDELLKHGAKHGISWVMDESEDIDGDLDGEDDTDYPIGDDEPGGLATLAGGWQATGVLATTSAGATSKELAATAAASRHQAQKKSINLRAMDMEKLQRTVREAQIEMEQARKEMEAAEKRYAKKGKEATKWRETMLKGKVIVGPD